jgi:hypothetical protein
MRLGRLVVLRHVRIEIVLPVPAGKLRRRAAKREAGEEGFLNGALVEHGQGTGQTEADGAGVRVRLVAEGRAAGAEHLGVGVDLGVDFKADGNEVGHGETGWNEVEELNRE